MTALRQFVRPRVAAERCDSCGVALPAEHEHQFEPVLRQVRCACLRCLRAGGSWIEIPREVRALSDFQISDWQWDELAIPIALAFFSYCTPTGRVTAFYPGPAGAAESAMKMDGWDLPAMTPDVEALLVNRVGTAREYFVVPIDQCYRLVGLIRVHWRGLSGGALVWGEIARFFEELRGKAMLCPA
jgi:hypothetical protein